MEFSSEINVVHEQMEVNEIIISLIVPVNVHQMYTLTLFALEPHICNQEPARMDLEPGDLRQDSLISVGRFKCRSLTKPYISRSE